VRASASPDAARDAGLDETQSSAAVSTSCLHFAEDRACPVQQYVGELPSQTTELADAVGRAESIDALDARITICCVGGVELIAVADPADVGVIADRVVDHERIIPRHSKDVVDANVVKLRPKFPLVK
jgi:hypothetical protein